MEKLNVMKCKVEKPNIKKFFEEVGYPQIVKSRKEVMREYENRKPKIIYHSTGQGTL